MSRYLVGYVNAKEDGVEVGLKVLVAEHLNMMCDDTIRQLCDNTRQIFYVQKLDERRQKRRKATRKVGWK